MAKLVVFAALVVAGFLFLGLAQASNKFTITTTVEEEDGNYNQDNQMWRCQQQIQQQMQRISHCQMYLGSKMMQQPLGEGPNERVLEQRGQMPMKQHLSQCCMALENMSEMCRCEAVKMAVRMCQGQIPGEMPRPGMEEMMRAARFLPQQCNMGPRECQI